MAVPAMFLDVSRGGRHGRGRPFYAKRTHATSRQAESSAIPPGHF
jgi:hypothetical protein